MNGSRNAGCGMETNWKIIKAHLKKQMNFETHKVVLFVLSSSSQRDSRHLYLEANSSGINLPDQSPGLSPR